MLLGEKIKGAVKQSGKSDEEAAVAADMSLGNLYKVYKRDSIETRYLVGICNMLEVDMNYFFEDQLTTIKLNNSGQSNFAHKVGKNRQSINVGGMSKEECDDKLKAWQDKYELLEKVVAEKERTIKILMKD